MQPKPMKKVEFRLIDSEEMPTIVISYNENDEPKVVINTYHKLWISLNRRIIAGILESLQEKMDTILTSYLQEQKYAESYTLQRTLREKHTLILESAKSVFTSKKRRPLLLLQTVKHKQSLCVLKTALKNLRKRMKCLRLSLRAL